MDVCVPLKNALLAACLLLAVNVQTDAQEPTVTTSSAERQVVCEVRLDDPVPKTSIDSEKPVRNYATAEEARMSERLHRRVTCRFENVDLVSIFNQIHRETGIVIAFDRASFTRSDLEKSGLYVELEDIDLEFKEVSLHSALTAILESVGFGYYVEDGIAKVTTKAKADDYLYICAYDCTELNEEGIVAVINGMIVVGGDVKLNTMGTESLASFTGEKGFSCSYPTTGYMVVRANRKTHQQVENVLSKIHKFEQSKALRKAAKGEDHQHNTSDNSAADLNIHPISYINEPSNFSELDWQLPGLKDELNQHKKELTHFMSGGIYITR